MGVSPGDIEVKQNGAIGVFASNKFCAIVGLKTDLWHFDLVFGEVLAGVVGKGGCIGCRPFLGKPKEGQAASHITGCVLPTGEL